MQTSIAVALAQAVNKSSDTHEAPELKGKLGSTAPAEPSPNKVELDSSVPLFEDPTDAGLGESSFNSGDEANPFKNLLDSSEDDEDSEPDFGTVEIYSENCLQCKSLVSFATKSFKNCHFSKGNTECPAASLRITPRVPVEKIYKQFKAAKDAGDNARLARLYSKLATFPDWYQQRVNEYLAEQSV